MSKTTKIRRLNSKLSQLERTIDFLEWSNTRLIKDLGTVPFKHYTKPPEFRSSRYSEQQYYNELIEYIYKKMDQLYDDAIERDQLVDVSKIKFTLYIGTVVLRKLMQIANYNDFSGNYSDGYTFRGQKVVEVISEDHVNFVRTA